MEFNFQARLGEKVKIPDQGQGRIIHARTTPKLFQKVRQNERLLSYRELIKARLAAFENLIEEIPKLSQLPDLVESTPGNESLPKEIFEIMAAAKLWIWKNTERFAVWMERYITSTSVIRGHDEVYFWDYQISGSDVKDAIDKGLQDGGFDYRQWMDEIKRDSYSSVAYSEYEAAKGGAFSAKEWQIHSVFNAACANDSVQSAYVDALDILSADSFHKPCQHSGWVQTGFPIGYGRPIALGLGEAAFYPPNNSTENHSGIVVAEQ